MDTAPFHRMGSVRNPCETIYVCESPDDAVGADHVHPQQWFSLDEVKLDVAHDRHRGAANYLFVDGHVERLTVEETWYPDQFNRWNPKMAPAWCTPFAEDWQ
jgi:prepilin-type processing-associated H-X9-DG protein